MYKPDGYTDLSPYLVVGDAEACLGFARAVFGSEPLRLHRREDGSVMHAEIRIGDTVVMLGQAEEGTDANLHVYCPDAVATWERALEAGGQVVKPLARQPDGDTRGGIRGPCGTVWWIASAG
ncbi:glyoxalase/bleomycin resistance/extradiol dioxygenase family protein [Poseidonocella sp. HB161398]|uniref:VOC family protein n=1 Tax=Poseidonocella sp. HB161398 TaxID=2320855 RepID=UPI0011094086|nr:VOC family protein [Poseidonocella sp. HB161398]